MTREQLLDDLAKVIRSKSIRDTESAKAVLDYITPMLEGVVEALENTKRDYSVALNNSYAVEAIMGDSYPERMQNDINRKFVQMQLEKITQALAQLECFVVNGGVK